MNHPNGNIRKAVSGNLDAAGAGDWPAFLDKGFAKPLLTKNPTFYSKPVPGDIAQAYAPLIAHAQAAIAAQHLQRHYALRDLLALYDAAYRKRREQAGVLLFSDVPTLLAAVIPQQIEGSPNYRLGQEPRHLLLDEFQDTDPRQYAILKPFAIAATSGNETSSGSGSLFCVGDRKQSIYGWRGATPQLFERLEREIPCLAWSNSDTSYRSSPAILHCVNTVFGTLADNAVLSEKALDIAAEWQSHYNEHTSSRPELAGYVELVQYAPDTRSDSEPDDSVAAASDPASADTDEKAGPNLRQAAAKIKAIRDAAPGRSIAVLTRTNDAVRALLPMLATLEVPAASESGSPIDDSPATLLVLSALTFADHPSDTAARFHLLNSPLAELLGLSGEETMEPSDAALHIRAKLSAEGYAEVIGQWTSILAPYTDHRSLERLTQLTEMADEYDAQHPGWHRPAEFVEWAPRPSPRTRPRQRRRKPGPPHDRPQVQRPGIRHRRPPRALQISPAPRADGLHPRPAYPGDRRPQPPPQQSRSSLLPPAHRASPILRRPANRRSPVPALRRPHPRPPCSPLARPRAGRNQQRQSKSSSVFARFNRPRRAGRYSCSFRAGPAGDALATRRCRMARIGAGTGHVANNPVCDTSRAGVRRG